MALFTVFWLLLGINFTILQNYSIWEILTLGQDYPVPVYKHDSDKTFTQPPWLLRLGQRSNI